MNVSFQDNGFGLPIYLLMGSLQSYKFCFKRSPNHLTSGIPIVSSSAPSSLFMLFLTFSALFVLSSPLCLPLFFLFSLSLSLSLSQLLSLRCLFSFSPSQNPKKKKNTSLSAPIPLYRLPLGGLKSLLFTNSHVFPLSPIIPRRRHVLWRFSRNLFLPLNCVR